jgi:hypothetical protein
MLPYFWQPLLIPGADSISNILQSIPELAAFDSLAMRPISF